MPKLTQYRIVKLQVESFKQLGFETEFNVQGYYHHFAPKIRLIKDTKEYRFSDVNWVTVSLQLARLYKVLKNERVLL
jgi:hypothetical protein